MSACPHTEQFLLEQLSRHPASQLQDLRKALYQSAFGCGHLVEDPSAAADWIRREAAESASADQEVERLDGPWSRVPLGMLADGLTPETLASVFRVYAKKGGHLLQPNCTDIATLRDAQVHPERHLDIVEKVCGFSARFVALSKRFQEEVIARHHLSRD